MSKFRKMVTAITLMAIIGVLIIATPEPVRSQAQFVISSWDFPDEYGQGIHAIVGYENSTGTWEIIPYFVYNYNYEDNIFDINATGAGLMLRVWTEFNSTHVGVDDSEEGKLYHQHHIIVTNATHTLFEQQNFTFNSVSDGTPVYDYFYDIIFGFIPVFGQIYTVTVTYEIWW